MEDQKQIIRERYLKALNNFREEVEDDPNVVALILLGSLSYGTVWEKSDMDILLVVRDGAVSKHQYFRAEEDGIDIELSIEDVKQFKNQMGRGRAGEFCHGYYGKGTIIFCKDPSFRTFFEENKTVGREDAIISCYMNIQMLITNLNRAEKWVTVFKDMTYAQHFLQWSAVALSEIVLLMNGEEPDRESILRASELMPELMEQVYLKTCTTKMDEKEIRKTIKCHKDYLESILPELAKPVLRYLSDHEVRTGTDCELYFGPYIVTALELMAEHGYIERVTLPRRLFKHTDLTVEEIAFMSIS